MPSFSSFAKFVASAGLAFGTVVVASQVAGQDGLRNQGAKLLRSAAKTARWAADKADLIADYLETQDGEDQVKEQWAKVDAAWERANS